MRTATGGDCSEKMGTPFHTAGSHVKGLLNRVDEIAGLYSEHNERKVVWASNCIWIGRSLAELAGRLSNMG